MKIHQNALVPSKECIPSETLSVNAIVSGQVAHKIEKASAQLATGPEIVPWQIPFVLECARENLDVVFRGQKLVQNFLFCRRCFIDFTTRAHRDLIHQWRQMLDEHGRMLLHPAYHEWKKSVCKKQHVHDPKFNKICFQRTARTIEENSVRPVQAKSLR